MTTDIDYGIDVDYPDGLTESGIPKRLRSSGTPICYTSWTFGYPGSRSDCYFLHSGRTEWFLWMQADYEMHGGTFRIAHGRMRKSGEDAETAAKILLKAFWEYNKKEWGLESPDEFTEGVIYQDAVSALIDEVWSEDDA